MSRKRKDKPLNYRRDRGNKWLVYASGFAGICMFISWLGENIFESELASKAAQIQRDVQFINSEMSNVTTWMLKFEDERRKQAPDPETIANSALQYGARTGTIVAAASRIDPHSAVLHSQVDEHEKLMVPLAAAVKKRDVNSIEEAASALMEWFGNIGPAAQEAMNKRDEVVSEEENYGKWVFRIFFLLGSLVLAGTWWKTNVARKH